MHNEITVHRNLTGLIVSSKPPPDFSRLQLRFAGYVDPDAYRPAGRVPLSQFRDPRFEPGNHLSLPFDAGHIERKELVAQSAHAEAFEGGCSSAGNPQCTVNSRLGRIQGLQGAGIVAR